MLPLFKMAISKLCFCIKVSENATTFFRLIRATKQFSYSKKKRHKVDKEAFNKYSFNLSGKPVNLLLRTYAGDMGIFYEIFWQRIYALTLTANPIVIVDAGANIGLSALFFHVTYPQSKIIAIEPLPANLLICKQNLQPYVKAGSIVLEEAALAATNGTVYLSAAEMDYNTSIAAHKTNISVPAISMNQLIQTHQLTSIDLLKVDIENGELELFSHSLEWLNIVQTIIIEIHSEEARKRCFPVLEANHFEMKLLGKGDTPNALYMAQKISGRL